MTAFVTKIQPAIPCSSKRCFQREIVGTVVCKLRMIWL
jgi:hypothetical protein